MLKIYIYSHRGRNDFAGKNVKILDERTVVKLMKINQSCKEKNNSKIFRQGKKDWAPSKNESPIRGWYIMLEKSKNISLKTKRTV